MITAIRTSRALANHPLRGAKLTGRKFKTKALAIHNLQGPLRIRKLL